MAVDHIFHDLSKQALSNTIGGLSFVYFGCDPVWSVGPVIHVLNDTQTSPQGYLTCSIAASAYTACWIKFSHRNYGHTTANRVMFMLSGPTQDLLRIVCNNSQTSNTGVQRLEIFNGATWDSLGNLPFNFANYSASSCYSYDILVKLHDTTGEFTIYRAGAQVYTTGAIDTLRATDTTITKISLSSAYASLTQSFGDYYSPIVVDSVDTRKLFWDNRLPASAGTYTEWGGVFSSLNYYLYNSIYFNAYLTGDAAGERYTVNMTNINAAYAGYAVEAVILAVAGQSLSEPGFYIKPMVRIGGVDYTPAGSFRFPSPTDLHYTNQLTVDPSTGVAWASQAAVNAAQLGVQTSNTA